MRSRPHRSRGGDLGYLNRLRVSIGLDREAIIGAQPERDLDEVFGHEAPPILVRVSKRSRMACLPDSAREIVGPVETIERGEIVWTTAIVLPSLAGTEQDAAVASHGRLRYLHIKTVAVQGDLTGDRDAGQIRAQVIRAGLKAEHCCKAAKPGPGAEVEAALGGVIISDRRTKIKALGCSGHEQRLRERIEPSRPRALIACRARPPPGPALPLISASCRGLDRAPPRDALLARGVGEPQQEIAVARVRRAEADEIVPAQFVERAQQ